MAAGRKEPVSVAMDGTLAIRGGCWKDAKVLAAGVAESYTLPTDPAGKGIVLFFASTGSFWINDTSATAAEPAADITDGSASELNPTVRYYPPSITSISLISTAGCIVSIRAATP